MYRARDLKLKREVAIKILPEEFSRDPDRVSRFQREAEVLASLNTVRISIYRRQARLVLCGSVAASPPTPLRKPPFDSPRLETFHEKYAFKKSLRKCR